MALVALPPPQQQHSQGDPDGPQSAVVMKNGASNHCFGRWVAWLFIDGRTWLCTAGVVAGTVTSSLSHPLSGMRSCDAPLTPRCD